MSPCRPLDIDESAQLVCKYLQAYENKEDPMYGIDQKFRGHESMQACLKAICNGWSPHDYFICNR